jgi:hypothetical protein
MRPQQQKLWKFSPRRGPAEVDNSPPAIQQQLRNLKRNLLLKKLKLRKLKFSPRHGHVPKADRQPAVQLSLDKLMLKELLRRPRRELAEVVRQPADQLQKKLWKELLSLQKLTLQKLMMEWPSVPSLLQTLRPRQLMAEWTLVPRQTWVSMLTGMLCAGSKLLLVGICPAHRLDVKLG